MKNLTQKIHQMFILGYSGVNPFSSENLLFESALKNGLGGVIFFTQNIENSQDFKNSVEKIKQKSLFPLFLSIDQEGGRVERTLNIHNGSKYLNAREAAKKGEDFVKKQTIEIAEELKSFGLNMNFSPVLDVDTNPQNPIIAERSFSSDANEVVKFGKICTETYIKNGIIPVGKHFPGHGETAVDSHKEMPKLDMAFDELESIHIKPFKELSEILPAIMVAHVHYSAFDKEKLPASVSENVVKKYLRQTLEYKGLIVSDDMVMGGIKGFSSVEACIRGINAGVNMFIFRNSDEQTLSVISELETAVKQGRVSIDNIEKSIEIIKKTKNLFNLS